MTKPSAPALTPAERASIPALQDEHNQNEVDTSLAAQFVKDAQARKDKQNATPTT